MEVLPSKKDAIEGICRHGIERFQNQCSTIYLKTSMAFFYFNMEGVRLVEDSDLKSPGQQCFTGSIPVPSEWKITQVVTGVVC